MERDDIIEYSLDNHHNEEQGKKIRKKIYFVTALLSVVTIIEVAMGIIWGKAHIDVDGAGWLTIKSIFIILTMLKAAYIVMTFMHLGDERKSLRNIILIPYFIFIAYLIFILLVESSFIFDVKEAMGWI
jgi:cytochrome c oxidase subunit IV